MCWQRWKTPAKFPDCKGKSQGNCIEFEPARDHIQWCVSAEQRNNICNPVTPTSQGSSTRRGHDCPAHRKNWTREWLSTRKSERRCGYLSGDEGIDYLKQLWWGADWIGTRIKIHILATQFWNYQVPLTHNLFTSCYILSTADNFYAVLCK